MHCNVISAYFTISTFLWSKSNNYYTKERQDICSVNCLNCISAELTVDAFLWSSHGLIINSNSSHSRCQLIWLEDEHLAKDDPVLQNVLFSMA